MACIVLVSDNAAQNQSLAFPSSRWILPWQTQGTVALSSRSFPTPHISVPVAQCQRHRGVQRQNLRPDRRSYRWHLRGAWPQITMPPYQCYTPNSSALHIKRPKLRHSKHPVYNESGVPRAVPQLGLRDSTAGDVGWLPSQGTKSCMSKFHMRCGQINT